MSGRCAGHGPDLITALTPGIDAHLERTALRAYTERTLTDAGALREVIEVARGLMAP